MVDLVWSICWGVGALTISRLAGLTREQRWSFNGLCRGVGGHGVFDVVHGFLVTNPGVPVWWPALCLAFDLTAPVAMVWLLRRRPGSAQELWQTGV